MIFNFFFSVQYILNSIPHQQFGSPSMKIKCFPKSVLNLRELNSCQSCIHRYKLAKAQVEGWSPSGQHSCGNYMFLMLGIWHFIPSEFIASQRHLSRNQIWSFSKVPISFLWCWVQQLLFAEILLKPALVRLGLLFVHQGTGPQGHQPKLKVCQCSSHMLIW